MGENWEIAIIIAHAYIQLQQNSVRYKVRVSVCICLQIKFSIFKTCSQTILLHEHIVHLSEVLFDLFLEAVFLVGHYPRLRLVSTKSI